MLQQELSEERRKEIFLALVEAQDGQVTVPQSRVNIANQFKLNDRQIRQIEREGLDKQWPPL